VLNPDHCAIEREALNEKNTRMTMGRYRKREPKRPYRESSQLETLAAKRARRLAAVSGRRI
jgi:hypothetical protein